MALKDQLNETAFNGVNYDDMVKVVDELENSISGGGGETEIVIAEAQTVTEYKDFNGSRWFTVNPAAGYSVDKLATGMKVTLTINGGANESVINKDGDIYYAGFSDVYLDFRSDNTITFSLTLVDGAPETVDLGQITATAAQSGGGSGLPEPKGSDMLLISNSNMEWEQINKDYVNSLHLQIMQLGTPGGVPRNVYLSAVYNDDTSAVAVSIYGVGSLTAIMDGLNNTPTWYKPNYTVKAVAYSQNGDSTQAPFVSCLFEYSGNSWHYTSFNNYSSNEEMFVNITYTVTQ